MKYSIVNLIMHSIMQIFTFILLLGFTINSLEAKELKITVVKPIQVEPSIVAQGESITVKIDLEISGYDNGKKRKINVTAIAPQSVMGNRTTALDLKNGNTSLEFNFKFPKPIDIPGAKELIIKVYDQNYDHLLTSAFTSYVIRPDNSDETLEKVLNEISVPGLVVDNNDETGTSTGKKTESVGQNKDAQILALIRGIKTNINEGWPGDNLIVTIPFSVYGIKNNKAVEFEVGADLFSIGKSKSLFLDLN